jgi:ADP-heptose:LPS heptosyltransferase
VKPESVRRLLFIRPRFLGDICLTLPLLDAARAACPGARVGYVLESGLAPLLEGDPRVDEVIGVAAHPSVRETLRLFSRLRAFRPDVVIDCFCNPRTAVWTIASGAPTRVGYPNKGWRSAMYTHLCRPRTLSATGFHLAALGALGWPAPAAPTTPRLHVGAAALAEAREGLATLGVPAGAALAGFHAGARWPTRRWDPANFVALAKLWLGSRPDAVALFTAGPGEQEVARRCVAELPAGRAFAIEGWPLRRFVALQSLCAVFVSGDTGPVHTAVASGARTLGLMSRNSPAMFFPYPESEGHRAHYARVECSPCHRDECDDLRCLKRLTVEGAWELMRGMTAAGTGR